MARKLIIYALFVLGVSAFVFWFGSFFYFQAHSPRVLDTATGHIFERQLKQTSVYLTEREANWIDYGMQSAMLFLGGVGFLGVKWGVLKGPPKRIA